MLYQRCVMFLTHILYADDIFIFAIATIDNVDTLASILDFYAVVFGQECSPENSRIFFGGDESNSIRRRLQLRLGFA